MVPHCSGAALSAHEGRPGSFDRTKPTTGAVEAISLWQFT